MDQADFAERIGVSRVAISNWERDKNAPDFDNLVTAAKLSGFYLEWLATERGPRTFGPVNLAEERGEYVVVDPLVQELADLVRPWPVSKKKALLEVLKR